MSHTNFWRVAAVIAAAMLGAFPGSAPALSIVHLDLDELVAASDAVVMVTIDAERHLDPDQRGVAFTETRVFVEQSLFGDVPAVLDFSKLGGVLPIPGVEQFERGESCILFLRFDQGRWWLTATGQSKMTLTRDDEGLVATRSIAASSYRRGSDGRLAPYHPGQPSYRMLLLRQRVALAAIAAWKERN